MAYWRELIQGRGAGRVPEENLQGWSGGRAYPWEERKDDRKQEAGKQDMLKNKKRSCRMKGMRFSSAVKILKVD
jgi:hypothetical protein